MVTSADLHASYALRLISSQLPQLPKQKMPIPARDMSITIPSFDTVGTFDRIPFWGAVA